MWHIPKWINVKENHRYSLWVHSSHFFYTLLQSLGEYSNKTEHVLGARQDQTPSFHLQPKALTTQLVQDRNIQGTRLVLTYRRRRLAKCSSHLTSCRENKASCHICTGVLHFIHEYFFSFCHEKPAKSPNPKQPTSKPNKEVQTGIQKWNHLWPVQSIWHMWFGL